VRPWLVIFGTISIATPLTAQAPCSFCRLDLPTPTMTRGASGAPGPSYWQQRADYVIRASLDTATKTVTGEERVTYTNHSPDTLRYLWFQVDQNLFTPDSRGSYLFAQESRFGTAGASGGVTLTKVSQTATPAGPKRAAQPAAALKYLVNGTMMQVDLARPLPPGGRQVLELAWSFPFGPNGNRMGIQQIDGDYIYEVAQWYPRLAVYDDVHGWNTDQYYGQGEFYLEYGSFDVKLTVPAGMIVAATGVLQNSAEVLSATQRARVSRARSSDTTIVIWSPEDQAAASSNPSSNNGTRTWHFTADSVRDFAWAAARHFIWDAVGVNGGKTLAMSFYPPSAQPIWKNATRYAKLAIERYSAQWAPFPYPTASNVNGVEGGMEYPMIVFVRAADTLGLYRVTDHEFGHTWFPMVVGSNERRYGWMDEGFNSFMNHYNWPKQFPEVPLPMHRGTVQMYLMTAGSGSEQPIMTAADQLAGPNAVHASYNKPALGLVLLRERLTSPERFDPVFREYIRRWSYKHPTPADFFRTMEDGLGEDLSWFWRSWFYTTETLDQAADSIVVSRDSVTGSPRSSIYLRMAQPMPMPVELEVRTREGTSSRLKLPVEVWFGGTRYAALVPGEIVGVTIDPDGAYPDVNRANNIWPAR
jgi:hypothetical protein